MAKKKTPDEKKQAEYDKDHFTFAWYSPHGFRKTWKKKKNYKNRVVRRKAKSLLHTVEGHSLDDLGPEGDSFTSELFRKGLSKKKLRKTGVGNLREKIQTKKDTQESRGGRRRKRKERFSAIYVEGIEALERDPGNPRARRLTDALRAGDFSLWDFLTDHPDWNARLRRKIEQLHKQQKQSDEKARSKEEQKRKWRSAIPTLRPRKQL